MALIPCSECARHIRSVEARCPFCGADTPEELRGARHALPSGRLGRAATFRFRALRGAALAGGIAGAAALAGGGLLVGCGGEMYGGPPMEDPGSMGEVYGGPPGAEEGAEEEPKPEPVPTEQPGVQAVDPPAEEDPGGMVEAYGAPPPPEE